MWRRGLVENVIWGGDWLKTSEYRHMGEGSKIAQKNRHMIFERSLITISLVDVTGSMEHQVNQS